MGYILQRLGGCVIQTPCCFASTILETPPKFFCLRPCTSVQTDTHTHNKPIVITVYIYMYLCTYTVHVRTCTLRGRMYHQPCALDRLLTRMTPKYNAINVHINSSNCAIDGLHQNKQLYSQHTGASLCHLKPFVTTASVFQVLT